MLTNFFFKELFMLEGPDNRNIFSFTFIRLDKVHMFRILDYTMYETLTS